MKREPCIDPTWSDGYHCDTCGCNYHCYHCNVGCSMMGHERKDDDGYFFTCLDTERAERWHQTLMNRVSR